jgi:hypothetical protein
MRPLKIGVLPISPGENGGSAPSATQASAAQSTASHGQDAHRPDLEHPHNSGRAKRKGERNEARGEADPHRRGKRQDRARRIESRGGGGKIVGPAGNKPLRQSREHARHGERGNADHRPRFERHVAEVDDHQDEERRTRPRGGESAGGARRGEGGAVGGEKAAEPDNGAHRSSLEREGAEPFGSENVPGHRAKAHEPETRPRRSLQKSHREDGESAGDEHRARGGAPAAGRRTQGTGEHDPGQQRRIDRIDEDVIERQQGDARQRSQPEQVRIGVARAGRSLPATSVATNRAVRLATRRAPRPWY